MFWGIRRSGKGGSDSRGKCGGLGLEQLEPRQLLSFQPAGLDPHSVRIDAGGCDESSILVRFRPEYRAVIATGAAASASAILEGTAVGRQLGQVAGLHKVSLSAGVGVEAALAAYRKSPWVAYA